MGITERNGQRDDGDTQQRHDENRTEMKETELMSKPVDGGMMKERISMGLGQAGMEQTLNKGRSRGTYRLLAFGAPHVRGGCVHAIGRI